ncbi:MAG: hypothetical protein EI684_14240, partial [Candidatus Viridilinea halotolerans]
MLRPLRPLLVLLFVVYATLALPSLQAAPPDPSADMLLHARPGYEGAFRVGAWLPILVDVENLGSDRQIEIRVGAREGAQYVVALDLPYQSRKTATIYAYMNANARRLVVRLFAEGQEVTNETLELVAAGPRARIIGLVSGPGAALRAPARLPDGTSLLSVQLAPADLPDHALGYSGLDALVLEDVVTTELSAKQLMALNGWVLRGGHLLLSGGHELPRMLAGLPSTLQPVAVPAVGRWPALELLDATARPDDVPLAHLEPLADGAGRSAYALPLAGLTFSDPLAIEQRFGQGSVTALSLPLGHPALAGWEGVPMLWANLLHPAAELPPGFAPDSMSSASFIENNLSATLTTLPALEFPPMGMLIGLVTTYILLVGPGTYFVLRRFDRQHLGWIVVPALTLLFASISYAWGYSQRGGDVLINQVILIEPSDSGLARVRSFVGLFSPVQYAYQVQLHDQADPQSMPVVRPASVHGPWELSGINAGGFYLQDGSTTAQARDFNVAQWAMRALASDTTLELGPIVARVQRQGTQFVGTIHNGTDITLRDVAFIQGEQIARLGDVAPGITLTGTLQPPRGDPNQFFGPHIPLGYLLFDDVIDMQNPQLGPTLSPDIQQRMRIVEALYNYGPSTRSQQPLLIAWADRAPLQVSADVGRSNTQQLALITLQPRLDLGP